MQNGQTPPKKQFTLSLLARVLIAVIVVVSIVVFASGIMRYNAILEEQKKLEEEVAEYREMREELKELLDSDMDDEYIVKVARELWGLYLPDEEIYYNDRNN